MAQSLQALSALAEAPCSVPITYTMAHDHLSLQCWGTQWPPLTSAGTRPAHNAYPYMSAERSYTEEEIFKIEMNVTQYRVKHFKPHNSLLFNTSQCWAATVFIEFQDVCTTGKEIWYPLSSHFPLSSSSSPTSLFSALLIYQFWVHHMNRIM